jgi:multisubunit Na+/H+ antiporter MnhB subunit
MSSEVHRRGRNWFTAMGVLFIVMGLIVIARNLLIWGPEFVLDFFLSAYITNEKISAGMIVFGGIMIILGFRKK